MGTVFSPVTPPFVRPQHRARAAAPPPDSVPGGEFNPAPILKPPPVIEQPKIQGTQGAGGHVADIASMVVNAFVAHKAKAEQVQQEKALQTVSGANAMWTTAAKNWQQLQLEGKDTSPNSTDPQVQQARAALNSAWQHRVQVYQQYTFPDHDQKKHDKGVKDAIKAFAKGEFVPQAPQLFAASLIQGMGQVKDAAALVPPVNPAASANYQEGQRAESDVHQSGQVEQQMRALAQKNNWTAPGTWNPQDQAEYQKLQRQRQSYQVPETGAQSIAQDKADVIDRWVRGDRTLNPDIIRWASGEKVPPNHTMSYRGADGREVILTTGPDGNVVNKQYGPRAAVPANQSGTLTPYQRTETAIQARNLFQKVAENAAAKKASDEAAAEAGYQAREQQWMHANGKQVDSKGNLNPAAQKALDDARVRWRNEAEAVKRSAESQYRQTVDAAARNRDQSLAAVGEAPPPSRSAAPVQAGPSEIPGSGAPPIELLQEGAVTTLRNPHTGAVEEWTLRNGRPLKIVH